MFDTLGATIYRRRWLTLGLTALFLLASLALLLTGGELTSGSIAGLEAERAQRLVEKVHGRALDTTFVAVFKAKDLDPDDQEFREALDAALAPLRKDPRVAAVVTPEEAPPAVGLQMVNGQTHTLIVYVSLAGDFRHALKAYPSIRAALKSDRLAISCTGQVPYFSNLDETLERDLLHAEMVSLPLALLVLLLVFRTVVAALLPVGVGALAVVGAIAVVLGLSRYTEMAQYTINVCSLIGLGVAIDYSLFTVSRYREELEAGHDYPEALRRTMATAGRVVAFSGLAVGSGLAGLMFYEASFLEAMGIGGAVVVILAVVFALTFLPALLAVLGPRIHAGRLPSWTASAGTGFWRATASWVMRHPVRVLVPTLLVLAWMGVPFFHLRMAATDVRVLPETVEARHAYEQLRSDFPDLAATRIEVAVRFPTAPAINRERAGALFDLTRRIAKLPHVSKVESVVNPVIAGTREAVEHDLLDPPPMLASAIRAAQELLVKDDVVVIYATTDLPPESEAARQIVREIRRDRTVADGTLLVGGQVATDTDTTEYILQRTPGAVAFVVLVTAVVLFVLFGSVVLPLKAVVMNFLSIAGSFGALVWIFQDGHLFIEVPRPVEPALPVILFCTLFGLSMDYEVLMLSRIKECFDETKDNTRAVADGLERTAGLITSAAAIMVAVFSAFALASIVLIQAVGFGMALAVALDATLVRVLLLPATMRLFGDLNWWAPPALCKIRRFLGLGLEEPRH